MKKEIYYAHHLWKYDTKIEEFELNIIGKNLPDYELFNPSTQFIFSEHMTEEEIMNECLKKVGECHALVFSSISGVVGKGVWSEVGLALEKNKDVYYLIGDELIKVKSIVFRECKYKTNRTYAVIDYIQGEE